MANSPLNICAGEYYNMLMQSIGIHAPYGDDSRASSAGPAGGMRAIENGFPFEILADISELESWRKEIHRPVYHMHKWWAQRLGSVFRACVLACFAPEHADILKRYYESSRLPQPVVFDPFMGSGTTLGEALKLGCRVIGRDINPVSFTAVGTALRGYDRAQVVRTFHDIEVDTADQIRSYYKARLATGEDVDVLYYFWVRLVTCPDCGNRVRLFRRYIFAQHAYAAKHPQARALCPNCGDIVLLRFDDRTTKCFRCSTSFDPQSGPAKGASAICTGCSRHFQLPGLCVNRGLQRTLRCTPSSFCCPTGTSDTYRLMISIGRYMRRRPPISRSIGISSRQYPSNPDTIQTR
ncbi:MAG: hypothetical protein HYX94_12745 [Chloroflexi bacterium]|nr:hypothetical protein [Chloroflexota bacterium]